VGGADLLVGGFDGGEHGPDVLRSQPVQGEVAEVRGQVGVEVAGVGAAGVLVHRPGGQPPLQVHRERGRPIQAAADVEAVADRVRRRQWSAVAGGVEQPGDLGDRGGIVAGQAQQGLGVVPGGERVVVGAVAAAAQLPPPAADVGREFEPVVPGAVAGAPGSVRPAQPRARAAAGAAAAPLEHVPRPRSDAHRPPRLDAGPAA
jgi:hypothetical protein